LSGRFTSSLEKEFRKAIGACPIDPLRNYGDLKLPVTFRGTERQGCCPIGKNRTQYEKKYLRKLSLFRESLHVMSVYACSRIGAAVIVSILVSQARARSDFKGVTLLASSYAITATGHPTLTWSAARTYTFEVDARGTQIILFLNHSHGVGRVTYISQARDHLYEFQRWHRPTTYILLHSMAWSPEF